MSIANTQHEINRAGDDVSPACPYCERPLHGRWLPRDRTHDMRWKCFRCNDLWWDGELRALMARLHAPLAPLATNGLPGVGYHYEHATALSRRSSGAMGRRLR